MTEHVLLIGGTGSFGRATAKRLLAAGYQVTLVGKHRDRLQAAQAELHLPADQGAVLDAANGDQLRDFFDHQPAFDHLVSFLGGAMAGGFLSADLATIRRAVEDKFFANLLLARLAVPHLNCGGSLTFTSGSGGSPATASGAIIGNQAINTMVAGLARELAPKEIRVNAVSPPWTPTGLWRDLSPRDRTVAEGQMASQIPLGRVGTVDEVAQGFAFVITNGFINGQVVKIDGGIDLA